MESSDETHGARSSPAIRVVMMPKDTNAQGTIFGGIILSYIDLAAAVEVRKHCRKPFVTVAMDEVVFKGPVFVGDIVSFYTELVRMGRTSITVRVAVEAERVNAPGRQTPVTQAQVVFVAIDENRLPIPIRDEKDDRRVSR